MKLVVKGAKYQVDGQNLRSHGVNFGVDVRESQVFKLTKIYITNHSSRGAIRIIQTVVPIRNKIDVIIPTVATLLLLTLTMLFERFVGTIVCMVSQ